jgi:hypothetical protein
MFSIFDIRNRRVLKEGTHTQSDTTKTLSINTTTAIQHGSSRRQELHHHWRRWVSHLPLAVSAYHGSVYRHLFEPSPIISLNFCQLRDTMPVHPRYGAYLLSRLFLVRSYKCCILAT